MIHIIDNFLSDSDCDELVKIYKENENDSYKYHGSFPLDISSRLAYNNPIIETIYDRIKSICYDLNDQEDISCYTFQLVKWNQFSFQADHYDLHDTRFSCILYLNDDYSGGNTVIEYQDRIKVKGKGRLLILENSDSILHSVQTISSGIRYTLAVWFEI
jgi:hypothetical protein